MSDATCKTCPWWDGFQSSDGLARTGECRRNPPVNQDGAPRTCCDYWCGEHPDRQPRIEYATTTLVTSKTDGPTAADMRRIVDALEKMASRAQRATP